MKKNYILALLVIIGFSMNAQNFVFSTDQHIEDLIPEPYTSYYIKFTTPSPEEITYKFETITNTIPEEWDFSLCDYTNCYVSIPATGTMTTISVDDAQNGLEGFFSLSVNPLDFEGVGFLELYVYDANDHERGDTVSWTLSYGNAVSTNELEVAESFKIYPNPTPDVLNIEFKGAYTGVIFNGIGKKVLSLEGDQNQTVDVSTLANGVYFISCQDESGQVFNKQFIINAK